MEEYSSSEDDSVQEERHPGKMERRRQPESPKAVDANAQSPLCAAREEEARTRARGHNSQSLRVKKRGCASGSSTRVSDAGIIDAAEGEAASLKKHKKTKKRKNQPAAIECVTGAEDQGSKIFKESDAKKRGQANMQAGSEKALKVYSSSDDNSPQDERPQGKRRRRRQKHKAQTDACASKTIQHEGDAEKLDAAEGEAPTKKQRRKRKERTEQPAAIAYVMDDESKGSTISDEPEAKKREQAVAQAGSEKRRDNNEPFDADQRGRVETRNMEPLRHASSMRESAADAQPARKSAKRKVEGILDVVTKFASVWFPSKLYDFLHEAASELTVRDGPKLLDDVDKFQAAFTRGGDGEKDLQEFLFKLRRLRVTFGEEFSKLSEEKTTACIWAFARGFILKPETLRLPRRNQCSRLNDVLDTQYIRYHQLRALIQIGLHPLENVSYSRECSAAEMRERWEVMLSRFLDYITDVETCAARYEEEGWCIQEETNRAPAVSTRTHDGQESCAPQWDSRSARKSQASGGSWQPSQWSSVCTASSWRGDEQDWRESSASGGYWQWQPNTWLSKEWQSKIPAWHGQNVGERSSHENGGCYNEMRKQGKPLSHGGSWQWQPNTWPPKGWQGKIPAWRNKTAGKPQKDDEMHADEECVDEEEAEKRRQRLERWKD